MKLLSVTNVDENITSSMNGMPRLTNRQKEILVFATRKGYFKVPKQILTQQIAEHFQISSSAILNHIQKAEKSIMEFFFG